MLNVWLQPIDCQDCPALYSQFCATFRQCLQEQTEQYIVVQHQIAHAALAQRDTLGQQALMNLGAGAMFLITQLPNTWNHIETEFLIRKAQLTSASG